MTGTRLAAAALMVLLTLTGCASGNSKAPSAAATVTVTASPSTAEASTDSPTTPSPTQDPYAPNVDDRALMVGQTREGKEIRTTVVGVKQPLVSANPYEKPDNPNQEWVGVRVKQCVRKDASASAKGVWADWKAVDAQGGLYQGSESSFGDFPSPEFPTITHIRPGQCVTGSLLIPVPKSTKVVAITFEDYLNSGPVVAEWKLSP